MAFPRVNMGAGLLIAFALVSGTLAAAAATRGGWSRGGTAASAQKVVFVAGVLGSTAAVLKLLDGLVTRPAPGPPGSAGPSGAPPRRRRRRPGDARFTAGSADLQHPDASSPSAGPWQRPGPSHGAGP